MTAAWTFPTTAHVDEETGVATFFPADEADTMRHSWITSRVVPAFQASGWPCGVLIAESGYAGHDEIEITLHGSRAEVTADEALRQLAAVTPTPIYRRSIPDTDTGLWLIADWVEDPLIPLFGACCPEPTEPAPRDNDSDGGPRYLENAPVVIASLARGADGVIVEPFWTVMCPWELKLQRAGVAGALAHPPAEACHP